MPRKLPTGNETTVLLQHLLAIELWRGGLSQVQIRKRLSLSTSTVNAMLKGVSKHVLTRTDDVD